MRSPGRRERRRLPGLSAADGYMVHPFDVVNGVRTSGLVSGRHLRSGHRHDRHATAYYAISPSVFEALLSRWRRTRPAAPLERFSFIDIGSGMGRALMLAAGMQFRRVIGVELNPALARIARRNLALWRTQGRVHSPVRIHCADAVELRPPRGPCLLFLFNPFGATVMRRLLQSLAVRFAGRPGELDILYANNEEEHQFEIIPGFERVYRGQIRRSRADAIADHAIIANQPDGEYASSNHEDCSIWRWSP